MCQTLVRKVTWAAAGAAVSWGRGLGPAHFTLGGGFLGRGIFTTRQTPGVASIEIKEGPAPLADSDPQALESVLTTKPHGIEKLH